MTVQEEIEHATEFGQKLEDLIVNKESVNLGRTGDRDKLLLAHWSLMFDYDKEFLFSCGTSFMEERSPLFARSSNL